MLAMKFIKQLLLTMSVAFMSTFVNAQCNTNTSICTPGTAGPFNFVTPGTAVSTCLDWIGPNTGYIILHITSSGPLNMLIDGSGTTGFLDVAVFNIPAGQAPCTAIQNTANQIGCNYATAFSGCNQFGTSFPCASSAPAPMVTAGQEIMIVVENWSGTSTNFTMQLGPPPGAQTGPPNPAITPVGPFCTTSAPVQLIAADMGGTWTGPGVSSTGLFNPATAGVGTHTINYSIGNAPCNAASSTTITVNSASISVSSPNTTICAGSSTTLNASGASTYTWTPSATLSASTGASVTATPTTTTTYSVTGTTAGCTNTQNITINVNPVPTVNAQLNQTHCAGVTVPITTFISPQVGTTFNWTNSNTAIGLGASGTGNLPSFTATNTGSTPITATISVTPVRSGCNGTPITFTITINPRPTVNPIAPITQCAGTAIPATAFISTPTGATFAWTNNNTAIGLGASGTGNQPAFTATNTGTSNIVSTITVTPTLNGCTGTASTYTITIRPIPTVTVPVSASYCPGANVPTGTFTTTPAGGTTSWVNSNTAIGLGASGTGNQPIFTAGPNTTVSTISGTISVTPTVNGCTGTPVNYTISIFPTPTVIANPDISVCTGNNVNATAFTSSPAGASFTWTNSNTAIGLGATGTGNQQTFVGTNPTGSANSGNIVVTPSLNGCAGTSDTYVITISPAPTMNVPANITQCGGAISPATFVSNPVGATFVWTNTNTSIGLAASGSGNIAAFTGTNGGAAPISGTVTVTPSIGTCIGTPVNFTITINPTPVISAITDITACENGNVPQTTISVLPASATTNWSNSNTAIGLGASGNGNVPAFTATNASSSAISGTVTINANANGCNAVPIDYVITITELPVVDPITDINQCDNTPIAPIAFSSSSANVTYSWTNTTTSIGLGASGSGNIAGFTASNPSTSAQTGTITVTPAIGTCIGTPETFTITVNPVPVPTAQNNGPLCPGDQLNLTASGLAGSTYSWTGPNGFTSGNQNPSITGITNADAGTYTVTVSLLGCVGSASTTLTMNPGVSPTITQTGPFCINDSDVQLSANTPGGIWSGNGITNPTTGQFSPTLAGAGLHTITYTLAAPCSAPGTTTIQINALPVVNFDAPVKNGCVPVTVDFIDQSVPASTTVLWNFGDGTTSTQTGNVSHTFNGVGCFDVTLTSTSPNGCVNTLTIPNFVCSNPYADASASVGDPTHTVFDPSFQFFNNSTNANSYSWDFGDGTGSTETNPTHEYAGTPGSYTVMLAANNQFGCPDTTYLTVVISDQLIFHVPNAFTPDGDEHNNMFEPIFFSGFDPQSYTLLIFDRWGEIIFESHDVNQGWHGTYLDGTVKEGVYTWTIQFKVSESDKKVTYSGHVTLLK